ncbi:MAG: hypothetical protein Q9209_007453 [Squamulea sp. 1 TL-2023]
MATNSNSLPLLLDLNDETKEEQRAFQLQILLGTHPNVLEIGVEEGVKLLDRLKASMVHWVENNDDARQWINQIDSLKEQAVKPRTIVGVVGNTGAGKSSIINAILDCERLVPTNCMRSCTVRGNLSFHFPF